MISDSRPISLLRLYIPAKIARLKLSGDIPCGPMGIPPLKLNVMFQ